MKKISLKNLDLGEVEQLTREQLKNVLGGYSFAGTTESQTNHDCGCSPKHCYVDVTNNPTPAEIQKACDDCCNDA